MNRALVVVALGCLSCSGARMVTKSDPEGPEKPGGNCYWSIDEGGTECEVEIATETRWRSPGTTEVIEAAEGYGKKKWSCGEKREVCGAMVECTCPFPAKDLNGKAAVSPPPAPAAPVSL